MNSYDTFGERVAARRRMLRVKDPKTGRLKSPIQAALAELLNEQPNRVRKEEYTRRIVAGWETDEFPPDAYALVDLAALFHVPERWLLVGSEVEGERAEVAAFIDDLTGIAGSLTSRQRALLRVTAEAMQRTNAEGDRTARIERLADQARALGPEYEQRLLELLERTITSPPEAGGSGQGGDA